MPTPGLDNPAAGCVEAGGTSARLHETAYDDTGVAYAKGRPTTTKDQAGVVSVDAYDFKGRETSTTPASVEGTVGSSETGPGHSRGE